ncbi:MAG: EndoU domain-containing protein [Bifidobacteriaceae bacterium]|jgi:hypothetical protein|nr:EndoU domain-containing protein [Bifidobacteriaceae bacterium]
MPFFGLQGPDRLDHILNGLTDHLEGVLPAAWIESAEQDWFYGESWAAVLSLANNAVFNGESVDVEVVKLFEQAIDLADGETVSGWLEPVLAELGLAVSDLTARGLVAARPELADRERERLRGERPMPQSGGSEYPERWDDETITAAVEETMASGTPSRTGVDSERRKMIDGVCVFVRWRKSRITGEPQFTSAYPLWGDGVFMNVSCGESRMIPTEADSQAVLREIRAAEMLMKLQKTLNGPGAARQRIEQAG